MDVNKSGHVLAECRRNIGGARIVPTYREQFAWKGIRDVCTMHL